MKSFFALVVVGLVAAAAGIHVQPPENTWARLNKSTTLKCKSSDPIQTCTWMTPTGSIHTLNRGQQAEGGRLKYNSDGEEDECGILIGAVEEKDVGAWTCVLGISLDETEVKSVSGKANVKLATKPSAVRLSTPFESAPFKEVKQDVACVVNNAQPKPVFTWYVGDELVDYPVTDSETDEGGVKSWVQTMEYSPRKSHANQTLRCVVEHVGLDDVDTKEAVVVLSFTEDFAEAAEVANAEAETEEDQMASAPFYAVAIVLSLLAVAGVGFFLYAKSRRVNMKAADNEEDVEAPVVEGEEKAMVENESESKEDEKKEEEEEKEAGAESKPSMSSCMEGLMGRCLKKQEAAEEKMEGEKEGEDKEEETKEADNKEKEAEENGVAAEDKTTNEEEEEKKEEKVEAKKKTSHKAKIMKYFKKGDRALKKEEGEKEEEGEKTAEEETGEEKKDEEKPSKEVEYEPEEKEEMNKKQEADSAEEEKKEGEEK